MADQDDVERLRRGDKDLTYADLQDADLKRINAVDVDFSNALMLRADLSEGSFQRARFPLLQFVKAQLSDLQGSILSDSLQSNFEGANLQQAIFKGAIYNCKLNRADIRGADFSAASINDQNDFTDVQFDSSTNFDGTIVTTRAVAKLPIFVHYAFDNGKLKRVNFAPDIVEIRRSESATPPQDRRLAVVAQTISTDAEKTLTQTTQIIVAIESEISRLKDERRNDTFHNDYIAFLESQLLALREVEQRVVEAQKPAPTAAVKKAAWERAASVLIHISDEVETFCKENARTIAAVAIVGPLGWFLTFCHCPPELAFTAIMLATGLKKNDPK